MLDIPIFLVFQCSVFEPPLYRAFKIEKICEYKSLKSSFPNCVFQVTVKAALAVAAR